MEFETFGFNTVFGLDIIDIDNSIPQVTITSNISSSVFLMQMFKCRV